MSANAVASLYRRSLKLALDWAVHRQSKLPGPSYHLAVEREVISLYKEIWQVLLRETEKLLETWKHPDPYRAPTAPGGSKYERNLPARQLPYASQHADSH
ncbi:hypothetical protein CNMCM6106_003855 [Aspergillus hiratsukae]|uniref:NADH dehydrogenase [ubiquinone] 1 beta subcomplex subunit 9 n=1 Tax=Aspergillus hiratsukae TaxID=1194566 RepID=A0A8H6QB28_9EURO|nr:hypothetical protein CNMCM6106_003855 [Aspergillus hiratsukae]